MASQGCSTLSGLSRVIVWQKESTLPHETHLDVCRYHVHGFNVINLFVVRREGGMTVMGTSLHPDSTKAWPHLNEGPCNEPVHAHKDMPPTPEW